MTTVPTLMFVGDNDDWTHASWCQQMMARRDGKGSPVTLIVYTGATHAFSTPVLSEEYPGHHLGYDAEATADAWAQVRSFLHKILGGSEADDHAENPQP